jgi:hypothetical protein
MEVRQERKGGGVVPKSKNTELERTVESPYVQINVSPFGNVDAKLTAYRTKVGGGVEEIILRFDDLDRHELACIGRSAVRALRELRRIQDKLLEEQLSTVTGWQEGDGPGA